MKTAIVFLADGFEEIEALTQVDILRRAGVAVQTVGVTGPSVRGAHGVVVQADANGEGFILPDEAGMVVLPGGGLGTQNLKKSDMVTAALKKAHERGIYLAAICAAPTVLHGLGMLKGRRVTAFPDVQAELSGAQVTGGAVEVDGNIITGRSAGVAQQFAHALVAALCGMQKADEVRASLYPEA